MKEQNVCTVPVSYIYNDKQARTLKNYKNRQTLGATSVWRFL